MKTYGITLTRGNYETSGQQRCLLLEIGVHLFLAATRERKRGVAFWSHQNDSEVWGLNPNLRPLCNRKLKMYFFHFCSSVGPSSRLYQNQPGFSQRPVNRSLYPEIKSGIVKSCTGWWSVNSSTTAISRYNNNIYILAENHQALLSEFFIWKLPVKIIFF